MFIIYNFKRYILYSGIGNCQQPWWADKFGRLVGRHLVGRWSVGCLPKFFLKKIGR